MSTSLSSLSSNFFPSPQNGFTTTLSSAIASGATTVPLTSVSGYSNGQVATFIVDPTDATKKQTFTGVVDTSGVQITSVVWTAGTNQAHTAGATVVDYASATHIAQISKGVLVSLDQDGTLKAGAVDNAAALASDVVTTAKILNANVTAAKMVNAGVFTGDASTTFPALTISDSAITTSKIANSAVTSAKVDTSVAQITAGDYKIQSGVATGSASASVTVNFSPSFSATPLVLCTFVVTSSGSGFVAIQSQSSSSFSFDTLQDWSTRKAGNCNWIAIGH